ncbi:hypothetical protein [Kingella kingae]
METVKQAKYQPKNVNANL